MDFGPPKGKRRKMPNFSSRAKYPLKKLKKEKSETKDKDD